MPRRATTRDLGSWELWWSWNSDPYLRDSRLASAPSTPRDIDLLTTRLAPKLADLLADGDARVVATGMVALARAVRPQQSAAVAAIVRRRLEDERPMVRDAAILSLGILRDTEAIAPLTALLLDREVPCERRQLAALALGLIGGKDAAEPLLASLQVRLCPDLAAASLVAAAHAAPESTRVATYALAILRRDRADASARAFAAIALSCLHGEAGHAALPSLLEIARDPNIPGELRASVLLALGKLGTPADAPITGELVRATREGGDPRPRTLALIALGRLLENDPDSNADAALRGPLIEHLLAQSQRPKQPMDRPWALLALGLALHGETADPAHRAFAAASLRDRVTRDTGAEERSAAALALGLMHDTDAAALLATELDRHPQAKVATSFLQSLGMLRGDVARPIVRQVAYDDNAPWVERIEAVRALARMGDSEVVQEVTRRFELARSSADAGALCDALAKLRTNSVIELLATRLPGGGAAVTDTRLHAASALGELTEPGSTSWWYAYSTDRDVQLRAPALRALLPE